MRRRAWQGHRTSRPAPVAIGVVALLLGVVAVNPVAGQTAEPSALVDGPPRPTSSSSTSTTTPSPSPTSGAIPRARPSSRSSSRTGLWLSAATGSTPTCCPGRANTLTGTWGHHSGVTENDMAAYDPADTVAVRLQEQGYRTYFGGKFLNRFPRYVRPPSSVEHYAAGWDEFDVGITNHGAYYDYPLWTRSDGRVRHGDAESDHSTEVVTNLMTEHIRATPPDEPIFAFLSLFDGHAPYEPMPRFIGDRGLRRHRALGRPGL